MTNQQHWLTPPHDKVYWWWEEACKRPPSSFYEKLDYVAAKAAEWGADQELEACREEILDGPGRLYIGDCTLRIRLADDIWTARRPRPKSLAEEALLAIDTAVADDRLSPAVAHAVRRALERLQELEGQSDG